MKQRQDPVSWYAIERGWSVMTLDGVPVGSVDEVQSDEELDIFHGLSVRRRDRTPSTRGAS